MRIASGPLLALLFWSSLATAQAFLNSIPNFFYDAPMSGIDDIILGRTCYSLPASPTGLDCNPAYMADSERKQLRSNILADRNIKDVSDYYRLVRHEDQSAIMEKISKQNEPIVSRAFANVWYQHEWWAVSYTPIRAAFASMTRNQAYTEVALHVLKEEEFNFRGGLFLAEDQRLRVGWNVRALWRQFIRQQHDLLADPSLLHVEKHRSVMVEPSLVYTFENSWNTAFSAVVTNLEVYREGARAANTNPAGELGLSARPDFANQRLVTSTHVTLRNDVRQFARRIRWGAVYDAEVVHVSLSLAHREFGVGLSGAVDSLTLGLGYKTEQISMSHWSSKSYDAVIFDLGLRF